MLTQTGATLAGNLNAALSGLGGSLGVNLPVLQANLSAALSGFNANVNAALTGALNGDFSGVSALVNAGAGLPTLAVQQAGYLQSGLLSGFVNGQLAFNQSLVANEIALQRALFGVDNAFNGAVNYGFNAFNLLLGTGEQTVNVLLGADMPANFMGSLLIGGSVPGIVPTGGLLGVGEQLVLLNGALGGDTSLLAPLGDLRASLANVVSSQLAFNQNLVANEVALQVGLFGTTSPLNGALNNFGNMINYAIGAGQQTIDVLLGAPVPPGFNAGLALGGNGDVFGGLRTGGALGAFEQKWLFDASVLSLLGFPVQVTLTGGLPNLLTQLSAALTGNVTVTGGATLG